MGNPEESAATLEERVNSVVKQLSETDGKIQFPEDLEVDPDVKYAATLEFRRRATQAAFTKGQQKLKAIEAEKSLLEQKVGSLSVKETQELEELKVTDPDEWYKKMRDLESQAQKELKDELTQVSTKASMEAELARRAQVLSEFNQSHPDLILTDELLEYDVPQRLIKELENGKVSYEDFLEKVYTTLTKPAVVGDGNKTLNQPDLGKLGGGHTVNKSVTAADIVDSYKNETY